MNNIEQLEVARAYVALSNAHRLDLILPLLSEDILYSSTSVGKFEGKNEVEKMMANFFTSFPDVFWEASDYQHSGDQTTSFNFTMSATGRESKERIERSGHEKITFNKENGLISKIEVIAQ